MAYLLRGFDCVFKSLLATSQNLSKNNHQSCKSRFSDQEIFSDLWTVHVGCNWQSLITHHKLLSPAHFSLPPRAWLRTLFKMRSQQHSLINLGSQAAGTGFCPSDGPVSPSAQLYWSTWWSSELFWLNSIPGKHLGSLHWLDLCRHFPFFWESFFKFWKTSIPKIENEIGFTCYNVKNALLLRILIRVIQLPPSLPLLLDFTFCFKVSKSEV